MLLAYRLLRLVETHSDALATALLEKTHNSPRLPDYNNVPPEELKQRVYEIYRHLADWLLGKASRMSKSATWRSAQSGPGRACRSVNLSGRSF